MAQGPRPGTSPQRVYAWANSQLMIPGPDFPQKALQHYWEHIKTPSHPTILLSRQQRYPVNYLIQRMEFFSAPAFHPYNKSPARGIGSVFSPCRSESRALPHFSVLFPPHTTHLISLTESWHTTSLPTSKCSSNSWTKAWQSEDCLQELSLDSSVP